MRFHIIISSKENSINMNTYTNLLKVLNSNKSTNLFVSLVHQPTTTITLFRPGLEIHFPVISKSIIPSSIRRTLRMVSVSRFLSFSFATKSDYSSTSTFNTWGKISFQTNVWHVCMLTVTCKAISSNNPSNPAIYSTNMRKLLHVHLIKSQLHAYKSIFLPYGIVNGNPATKPIQYLCTAVLPREDMRTLTILQYSGKHLLFAFFWISLMN